MDVVVSELRFVPDATLLIKTALVEPSKISKVIVPALAADAAVKLPQVRPAGFVMTALVAVPAVL